jgi:hypothetical protein
MVDGTSRVPVLTLAILLGGLLPSGTGISGQAALGTQLSLTEFQADETSWGPGFRALLRVPLTGLAAQGTYDTFRRPCGPDRCRHRDVGFALLWSFPVRLLADPYLGLGVAPEAEEGWKLNWDGGRTSVYALGGLRFGGSGFQRTRFFAEAKHNFRERQLFISAGILLFLF